MKFSCDNLGFRVNFILLQLQCGYNNMRPVFSIKKKSSLENEKSKKCLWCMKGEKATKKTFEQTCLVQFLRIVMLF